MPTTTDGPLRRQHRLGDFELSVLEAGPTDGEPVVLLHGIPTGAELWRDVLVALAEEGYRGFAPDLPGYGLTRVPADADHSLAGAAELVAAWIRGTGIDPVWAVGHDLGASVQILAVRHRELVSRMTLTNTVVHDTWPVTPVKLLRLAARSGLYPALVRTHLFPNPYLHRELRRAFADPDRLTDDHLRRVFFDGKVVDVEGRRAFQRHAAAITNDDTVAVADDLADLDISCQLVWGMEDPFQPWELSGVRLSELLRDPAVTQLPDCGHFVPLECPDRLVQAMIRWRGSAAGQREPVAGT